MAHASCSSSDAEAEGGGGTLALTDEGERGGATCCDCAKAHASCSSSDGT
jgi:hypothetical protein